MAVLFTADQHFGHANVIEYARRPFKDVHDMNEELVRRWNAVVQDDDVVHMLGDVALCRVRDAVNLVRRLRGHKRLVFGNHDKRLGREKEFLALFESAEKMDEIRVPDPDAYHGEQRIVLCHYAMRIWDKSHYGSWQLYGHSHGSLKDDPHALSLDVGVDCWDYAPVTYTQVKARMKLKDWKPIDHHRPRR